MEMLTNHFVQTIRAIFIILVAVPLGIVLDTIDSLVTFLSCILLLVLGITFMPLMFVMLVVMPHHPATLFVEEFFIDTMNVLTNSYKVFFPEQ